MKDRFKDRLIEYITRPLEEGGVEYIIRTRNKDEAEAMINAMSMLDSIHLCYDQVLRDYVRHPDDHKLTEGEHSLAEEISNKLNNHFEEYF